MFYETQADVGKCTKCKLPQTVSAATSPDPHAQPLPRLPDGLGESKVRKKSRGHFLRAAAAKEVQGGVVGQVQRTR